MANRFFREQYSAATWSVLINDSIHVGFTLMCGIRITKVLWNFATVAWDSRQKFLASGSIYTTLVRR